MANIHIYINPTNDTDGMLASEGSMAQPITVGPYKIGEDHTFDPIKLAIRTLAGWRAVGTVTVDPTTDKWALSLDGVNWLDWGLPLTLSNVTDVNTVFYVRARVLSTETLTDETSKLQIKDFILEQIAPANSEPTVTVNVTGNTTVGSILTAATSVNDPDGDTVSSTTWRWLRSGVVISGATSNAYTLVEADVGKQIKAEATVTMSAGPNPSATLSSGTTIPVPAAPTPTLTPASGKVTTNYTDSVTLTTDSINAYYTTDDSTPTTSSTVISNVTSPFDITASNGTTVKVALARVINGVVGALSSVASGSPALAAQWTFSKTGPASTDSNFDVTTTAGVLTGVVKSTTAGQEGALILQSIQTFNATSNKKYFEIEMEDTTTSADYITLAIEDSSTHSKLVRIIMNNGNVDLQYYSAATGMMTPSGTAKVGSGRVKYKFGLVGTTLTWYKNDSQLGGSFSMAGFPATTDWVIRVTLSTTGTSQLTKTFDNVKVYDADGTTVLFSDDFSSQRW